MTGKPRGLDLYCGAGGASVGYARAGFEVTGVDIRHQPHYPFPERFIQADALEYVAEHGCEYHAIFASPPCQAFTALKTTWNAKPHSDLLTPTREALQRLSVPWIIENVPGAPTRNHIVLCGTMFGLGVGDAELRRHRWFETSPPIPLLSPPCGHGQRPITIGVYGQHGRDRRRSVETLFSIEDGRQAMGIDWMTGDELSQAIPPAYTEFIGRMLLSQMQEAA